MTTGHFSSECYFYGPHYKVTQLQVGVKIKCIVWSRCVNWPSTAHFGYCNYALNCVKIWCTFQQQEGQWVSSWWKLLFLVNSTVHTQLASCTCVCQHRAMYKFIMNQQGVHAWPKQSYLLLLNLQAVTSHGSLLHRGSGGNLVTLKVLSTFPWENFCCCSDGGLLTQGAHTGDGQVLGFPATSAPNPFCFP